MQTQLLKLLITFVVEAIYNIKKITYIIFIAHDRSCSYRVYYIIAAVCAAPVQLLRA